MAADSPSAESGEPRGTAAGVRVYAAALTPAYVWNLLFAGWRDAERQQELDRLTSGDVEHLTIAAVPVGPDDDEQRQAAAALVLTLLPNRTGIVGIPKVADEQPCRFASAVLDFTVNYLAERRVALAQALLNPVDPREAELFAQAGFEKLAELVYLACPRECFPEKAPDSPLELVPYGAAGPDGWRRLVQAMEQSYRGTLDCPRLNGLRPTEEVAEGFRYSGDFLPQAWLLARCEHRDVGCLIVTRHGASGIWELAYMGLAPEARGHGLGMSLVRQAQWLARMGGGVQIIVAVDAANLPALHLYRRAGFVEFERKSAWFRLL